MGWDGLCLVGSGRGSMKRSIELPAGPRLLPLEMCLCLAVGHPFGELATRIGRAGWAGRPAVAAMRCDAM